MPLANLSERIASAAVRSSSLSEYSCFGMCSLLCHYCEYMILRALANIHGGKRMETKNAEAPTREWLTYKQASAYCGLGRTTLTTLITSGAVPAARVGKAVRISKAGLDEYMRRNAYTETAQE
jgi:excisionase family DNA binding protein